MKLPEYTVRKSITGRQKDRRTLPQVLRTVSYTHLDVYKRQLQHPPVPHMAGEKGTRQRETAGIRYVYTERKCWLLLKIKPHSKSKDVYKRQRKISTLWGGNSRFRTPPLSPVNPAVSPDRVP